MADIKNNRFVLRLFLGAPQFSNCGIVASLANDLL